MSCGAPQALRCSYTLVCLDWMTWAYTFCNHTSRTAFSRAINKSSPDEDMFNDICEVFHASCTVRRC